MKLKKFLVQFGLMTLFAGCGGVHYTVDPSQTTYSREDILAMPDIEFPANYNTDNLKDLKLGVAVKVEGHTVTMKGAVEGLRIDPNLSARLQGQLGELKRFTVYSVHNRNGVKVYKQLSDIGQVSLAESDVIKPDYILNVNVNITKESHAVGTNMGDGAVRHGGDKVLVVAECDANCVDLESNTVYFSEKTRGRHWYLKKPGYDSGEPVKLQEAQDQAAKKAIVEMMNRIGNYFPCGGKVVDVSPSGKRMTLNCGSNRGVAEGQQLVVFIRDNGVDIPLALAEAQEGREESTLDVYKWNADDPDALEHIQRYRLSPGTFATKNDIFAVGYGLPPSKKMDY